MVSFMRLCALADEEEVEVVPGTKTTQKGAAVVADSDDEDDDSGSSDESEAASEDFNPDDSDDDKPTKLAPATSGTRRSLRQRKSRISSEMLIDLDDDCPAASTPGSCDAGERSDSRNLAEQNSELVMSGGSLKRGSSAIQGRSSKQRDAKRLCMDLEEAARKAGMTVDELKTLAAAEAAEENVDDDTECVVCLVRATDSAALC